MHIPVLLNEVLQTSNISKGDIYVDGTLGLGGHAYALYTKASGIQIIGFDKDNKALQLAREKLQNLFPKPIFIQKSFTSIQDELQKLNIKAVDCVLLDLGVSSLQFDGDDRGFSFRTDAPLHMNMDHDGLLRANMIINEWSEESIANILFGYGEEKFARRIARHICDMRKKTPIQTTFQLASVVEESVPLFYKRGRIHPATKTFQALRIAVNNELEELSEVIPSLVQTLKKDGRMLIISFHSLEDRIVKRQFKQLEEEGYGRVITKKPIIATEEEISINPRARSAKLRVFQKV